MWEGVTDDPSFVSDVDEIPKPAVFEEVKGHLALADLAVFFEQEWHVLFLNVRIEGDPTDPTTATGSRYWLGTVAFAHARFHSAYGNDLNRPWGLKWIKPNTSYRKIKDAGWHLSYMGGMEAIVNKAKAAALNPVTQESRRALQASFSNAIFSIAHSGSWRWTRRFRSG